MTSPSTATDGLDRLAREAADQARELAASSVRGALEGLSDAFAYAEFFAEASRRSLADARVRVLRGKPVPATYRVRDVLVAGFSLRAFDTDRQSLVWSEQISERALFAAAARVASLMDPRRTGTFIEPLNSDPPPAMWSRVRQEPWGEFLVERLVDAALSANPDIVEVRVRRVRNERSTLIVAQSESDQRSEASSASFQLTISTGNHAGVALSDGAPRDPESLAREAVARAREHAQARPLDLGSAPVVVAGGWGGVWLHEAVGHALEADTVRAMGHGIRPGDRVGPEWLTVCDDPHLEGGRGAYAFDDEATPAAATFLIDHGRVGSVLSDRFHARALGLPRAGNGRRATFRELPLPRMSNLVMAAGEVDEDSLFAEASEGVFICSFGEGCLDGDGGSLRLTADRAFRIRSGRVAEPILGVTVVETPGALLNRLRAAGRVASTDPARGVCRKGGQSLPVSIMAPAVLFAPLSMQKPAEKPA